MPDVRRHRGAHPDDRTLFSPESLDCLRAATADLSWLLTRGYAQPSALKIVGDRHGLTSRQRLAVLRCSCSDESLSRRRCTELNIASCAGQRLAVDGYNLLITIESALAGGLLLVGRDGACRDLASLHGSYRKVEETRPALQLIIDWLCGRGFREVAWYLDRPVSNSGRLKQELGGLLTGRDCRWTIEVVDSPDPVLAAAPEAVVSTDSWILDRCGPWVNVAAHIVETEIPQAWKVDLRTAGTP
jgi:hypothetical protein